MNTARSSTPSAAEAASVSKGVAFAALSYLAWGLFPLYFATIREVPALEVVLHRTVWCLLCVLILLAVMKRFAWLGPTLRDRKVMLTFGLSAFLLSISWLVQEPVGLRLSLAPSPGAARLGASDTVWPSHIRSSQQRMAAPGDDPSG